MKQKRTIVGNNEEQNNINKLLDLFLNSPIPNEELINNLGIYTRRQILSRIFAMYELYKKIVDIHGVIVELGVKWGQNLVLFENFRGILEPFNYNRKIIGFDTFSGFPSLHDKDNKSLTKVGDIAVTPKYEQHLAEVLRVQEGFSPISHIKKHELVKGDATKTFKKYLDSHPETILSLVYFDFDLYEPTKVCLELCKKHITKGTVLAFDELAHPDWPGETIAVKEALGLSNFRLQRFTFMPTISYVIVE